MNPVALGLALLEGLALIVVGTLEAFFFRDQRFYGIFLIRLEDIKAVRLWVVNLGIENILVGLTCILGVILLSVDETVGRTMVFTVCALHIVLGPVLAISEPLLWKSAIAEALLPLLVIVTALAF